MDRNPLTIIGVNFELVRSMPVPELWQCLRALYRARQHVAHPDPTAADGQKSSELSTAFADATESTDVLEGLRKDFLAENAFYRTAQKAVREAREILKAGRAIETRAGRRLIPGAEPEELNLLEPGAVRFTLLDMERSLRTGVGGQPDYDHLMGLRLIVKDRRNRRESQDIARLTRKYTVTLARDETGTLIRTEGDDVTRLEHTALLGVAPASEVLSALEKQGHSLLRIPFRTFCPLVRLIRPVVPLDTDKASVLSLISVTKTSKDLLFSLEGRIESVKKGQEAGSRG